MRQHVTLDLAVRLKDFGITGGPQKAELHEWGIKEEWKLPSLSQLLAEIKRHCYGWKLHDTGIGVFMALYSGGKAMGLAFESDTPEDAAALALIWILERGQAG